MTDQDEDAIDNQGADGTAQGEIGNLHLFHLHRRAVGQHVLAGDDDLLTGLEAGDDLDLAPVVHAEP